MERELPQDISFNDMNNGDIYLNTITTLKYYYDAFIICCCATYNTQ